MYYINTLKQEFGTAKTYGGGSICYGNAFIAPSTKVSGLHAICQTINLSSTGLKVHKPLFYLSGSALFAQTKSIFSTVSIHCAPEMSEIDCIGRIESFWPKFVRGW